MLYAISPGGLYELLVKSPVDPFDNIVSGSKVCVTRALLDAYERHFASYGVTERDIYEAFLRSLHARLKAVDGSGEFRSRAAFPDQVVAAHFGGKNLVASAECAVVEDDAALLASLGVRVGSIETVFEPTCLQGFEPFERFVTVQGVAQEPRGLVRFFQGERDAVFYDRFVNSTSLALIEYLVERMEPGGNILIATSRNASLLPQAIRGQVARWSKAVSVAIVDRETSLRLHDRHIFVGRHYQLHVPRGLDIYGQGPRWINENGRVDVYDCYRKDPVLLSFERDGASRRRDLRLPAAVVA